MSFYLCGHFEVYLAPEYKLGEFFETYYIM